MHAWAATGPAAKRRAHLAWSPALGVNVDHERGCRLHNFALVVRLGRDRLRTEASLARCGGPMGQAGTHLDEVGLLRRHEGESEAYREPETERKLGASLR